MIDRIGRSLLTYDDAIIADEMFSSYRAKVLNLPSVEGYVLTNPSVARWSDKLWGVVRAVNYSIFVNKYTNVRYEVPQDSRGESLIKSRNFLISLSNELEMLEFCEIHPPCDWPQPRFSRIIGLEDSRLFEWKGQLWCLSSVRELNADGKGRMLLSCIRDPLSATPRFSSWRLLHREGPLRDEKNWMPQVKGDDLRFIYTLDPLVILDDKGSVVDECDRRFRHRNVMRGSSQFIAFDGDWLGVAHELIYDGRYRYYYHRFVLLDHEGQFKALTGRFYFTDITIEFCGGICWSLNEKNLIISFGVEDRSCWMAVIARAEISAAFDEARPIFRGSANFLGGAALPDEESNAL